jgi:hypothetical protein
MPKWSYIRKPDAKVRFLNGKKNGGQKQDGRPFENRTGRFFIASLDRFVMNKIFFMTLFLIKRSRLANRNPDTNVRFSNGPDIKWPILA